MIDGLPAPQAGLRACVVVPVRDEAARLPATLAALAAQRDAPAFEVLLLANNCSDASAEVARRFAAAQAGLRLHVVDCRFDTAHAHVGHARRVLMDTAAARLEAASAPGGGVIASTDGDSRVAPDWLAATLREIDAGADAVGGRLLADRDVEDDPAARRWQRWDLLYRLARERLESLLDPDPADPWPRHHQHFGASLAVRAGAYRAVGGLPRVRWLEDEALVAALRCADRTVRHSPAVRVVTSSRREGRVDVGLSWQLREWDRLSTQSPEMEVDDAAALLREARARACLRRLWRSRAAASDAGWADVAQALAADAPALREATLAAPAFGALWAAWRASAAWPPPRRLPVRAAVAELRALIAAAR